jgi:hypothetical protein
MKVEDHQRKTKMSLILRKERIAKIIADYAISINKVPDLADLDRDCPSGLNRKGIVKNFQGYAMALKLSKSLYPEVFDLVESKPQEEEKQDPLELLRASTTEN